MNQIKEINDKLPLKYMLLLMLIAYMFSFAIRMIWVYQFQDNADFYWNGQLMINTNDGYTWAAGVQNVMHGLHENNPGIRSMWGNAVIFFTVLFTKFTPFSLETVILYMPSIIASLVVIPIILIARLYGQVLWGFFAALLGAIIWSYYNRTMTGYYDTDMFSAMAPMFILYFLMKSTMEFNMRSALYAAIAIAMYPFLYDQGKSIVYAMGILYALYMIFYHRNDTKTYALIILVFFALLPLPMLAPWNYITKIVLLIGLYFVLKKTTIEQKNLIVATAVLFVLFMYFGNVFGLIMKKVMSYVATGTTTEGLHFYGVHQTVREAGKTLFFPAPETMPYQANIAHRMMGSSIGLIVSLIGYIILLMHKKEFILALPLIGIGIFAHWGGLRFTVYAVPIAALSAIYLLFVIGDYFKDKRMRYVFITLATVGLLYPNIQHIIDYKVPTVLNKAEVEDLVKLNEISDDKDYTLAWWDYGYPIWFYSETSTLIDGGKHNNDNFIISTLMQTSSAQLAANLGRLAIEEYVKGVEAYNQYLTTSRDEDLIPQKYKMVNQKGVVYHGGKGPVSNHLFKNGQQNQIDPNMLLSELENDTYTMPKKTRDIYLYLPYRMLRIFPTVAIFGNLDLKSGEEKRKIAFYPTVAVANEKGKITLGNGMIIDTQKGEVSMGSKRGQIRNFIVTQNTKEGKVKLQSQLYHMDGGYAIVYMKSYGKFVMMDVETFNSTYVQMFMLGKYDKNLFELVISSPYSKIYKLRR